MKRLFRFLVAVATPILPLDAQAPADLARWEATAARVTITRDDWGIAHVHGKTDADAVFGMIYAQAEDDFNRVEHNYLLSLGRLAEAEGESAIWTDLRQRLFIDADTLRALYRQSPDWLRALMDGWADGLNFYLHRHPAVHPRVITRFEPWMALSFSEGSIGGDIERVSPVALRAFYDSAAPAPRRRTAPSGDGPPPEPGGSNGIAIAPRNTANGHALLFINPHTSFYFRSELQMTSDEGLDAYGAVTWGQFFIYQGFNASAGWMHTSSGVDNVDEFLNAVEERPSGAYYRYDGRLLPTATRKITVPYRTADGRMASRTFTAQFTRHGPVVRREGDRWVSVALMNDPVHALIQSYSRTKARNLGEFLKIMELHTNSSNNTLFADREGNIAYLHSNYIPRRDTTLDWSRPVDGSLASSDYRGVLSLAETPNAINPASGWAYNSNNWPWSAAGADSPVRDRYPAYVETGRHESMRGLHAMRVLSDRHDFTMQSLTDAAYDSYLPSFGIMVPALLKAFDATASTDPLRNDVAEAVGVLRDWDFRWGAGSVATSLAVYWGGELQRRLGREVRSAGVNLEDYVAATADGATLLQALAAARDRLTADFGQWRTPWGEINRFQRLDDRIDSHFDDARPSIPVPFTSATWGSLASFGARPYPNTKKWYGTSGNSFIAVVEFGDRLRARAVTAGGESGDPASLHFNDQASRYAAGDLREVYFYPEQLTGHTERQYHPGD